MAKGPNILFILTDQQTIGAMSAAGNPHLSTPAMDTLAACGARFTKSWCPSPVCGSSRASLFSGRMPHQLGAEFNPCSLPDGVRTIGENFRKAGYETTYIGKWHVPQSYPSGRDDILGFDYQPIAGEDRLHLGEVADPYALAQAKAFLAGKHEEPFFLTVSLLNPHDICHHISGDCEDVISHYWPKDGDELPPLPDNFALQSDEPRFLQIRRNETKYGREMADIGDWDEPRWRQYLFAYYRMTETVDAHIGAVLEALKNGGHADDTIVVFTSDHGESVAAHQMVVKLSAYEESLAVPLIIQDPRLTLQGKVIDDWHASGVDLAPTLLELAGLAPDDLHVGRSLAPALRGESDARGYVAAEVHPQHSKPDISARAIRAGDWKYTAFQSDEGFEEILINLAEDPGEMNNLLGQLEGNVGALRLELIANLRQWLAHTDDPFPTDSLV